MNLSKYLLIMLVSLLAAPAHAAKKKEDVVEMSGISIIGNRELPKTLFIVPWKNSEVGVETELTNTLNEGMQPLDREVFERELDYYEFSKPQ
jgi:hypothetical protein